MDQLEFIFSERASDEDQLGSQIINSKQHYHNRQKNRIKNQNLILKQLSSYRNPTIQLKQSIYQSTVKMMNQYSKMPVQEVQYQSNFTIAYINLYVRFFNIHNYQSSSTNLKVIVRPNNGFLIADLIRSLIQFSRMRLKKKMQELFKDDFLKQTIDPRISFSLKPKSSLKIHAVTQQTKIQEIQELQPPNLNKNIVYDRYRKFIYSFDIEQTSQKINSVFLLLNQLNNHNRVIIAKYRQSCCGNKRNINYDYSGLYTTEERDIMFQKLNSSINEYSNEPKVMVGCSAEDLNKNWKIVQQIEDMKQKLNKKKMQNVNHWISMRIEQNYERLPYTLMVTGGKEIISAERYSETMKKPLKQYLQQKLNQWYNENNNNIKDIQKLSLYKKEIFLNFNRKKVQQILQQERFLKKQSILPYVKNMDLRQFTKRDQFKSKHKSQTKLVPLLKQCSIKRTIINQELPSHKISRPLKIQIFDDHTYNCLTRQKNISTFHL